MEIKNKVLLSIVSFALYIYNFSFDKNFIISMARLLPSVSATFMSVRSEDHYVARSSHRRFTASVVCIWITNGSWDSLRIKYECI